MEAMKSVLAGYKNNWIPALIGAIGGYLIVKKGFKSGKILALGTGVLVGSLAGSMISIKSTPKVISTTDAPTKP